MPEEGAGQLGAGKGLAAAVERMWHTLDSQGQILALR
jgi:hypothetical protein